MARDDWETEQDLGRGRRRVQAEVWKAASKRVRSLVSVWHARRWASCQADPFLTDSLCRWDFAVKNSLLLPDEYDRIHLDLAPFWALPRAEMRQRVREAMDLKETFVLVVENGTVSVEVSHARCKLRELACLRLKHWICHGAIGPGSGRSRLGWYHSSCQGCSQVRSLRAVALSFCC